MHIPSKGSECSCGCISVGAILRGPQEVGPRRPRHPSTHSHTALILCSLTAPLLLSASQSSACTQVLASGCAWGALPHSHASLRFTLPAPRTQGGAMIWGAPALPPHSFLLSLSALLLLLLRNLAQSPSLFSPNTPLVVYFHNINTLLKEHLNLQFNTYSISICSSTVSQSSLCQAQGRLEMNSCCLYSRSRGVGRQRQTFVK